MRREVMADVRQLQAMLENHAKEGLPAADIQVIRRGKALEYFSRHYGKVYVDEGRAISVKDALVGINQLIDEDADKGKEVPLAADLMSKAGREPQVDDHGNIQLSGGALADELADTEIMCAQLCEIIPELSERISKQRAIKLASIAVRFHFPATPQ